MLICRTSTRIVILVQFLKSNNSVCSLTYDTCGSVLSSLLSDRNANEAVCGYKNSTKPAALRGTESHLFGGSISKVKKQLDINQFLIRWGGLALTVLVQPHTFLIVNCRTHHKT
uniref:Uncharacterized protein n=1 Tax=Anguilla anguilla TaxID=7936 RepID=A0A0E9X9A6_ANGAN